LIPRDFYRKIIEKLLKKCKDGHVTPLLLLLLLLIEHLYSALSLNKISNAIHVLCQYVAKRKHLSERLKESRVRVSSFRYAGRLFHADGPAQESANKLRCNRVHIWCCTCRLVRRPASHEESVLELQQQLHEKDMKLTDIRLEALSSAHQLEQLRDTMNQMKVSSRLIMRPSYGPHYASCPSVCLFSSVCPVDAQNSKTKKRRKTKIDVEKVKVQGRRT